MSSAWNPDLYQSSHSFVWQFGKDLLALLAPQPGERILDIGCGTGQLTAEIAASGAEVTGLDNSPAMIAEARRNYPLLAFELRDVCDMPHHGAFDAVFSNAALHWVKRAEDAASAIARALKPGGRFVAELGGRGNTQALLAAAREALRQISASDPGDLNPWYFPSIGEYARLLESRGLEVTQAWLFDRPTRLEGGSEGLARWCEMFGAPILARVPESRRPEFLERLANLAAPSLLRESAWHIDYRRLRLVAHKPKGV